VELFEQIRRSYDDGVGSIQGVARQFGVHRRLVREALGSAVPVERPMAVRRRPRVEPVMAFIDAILAADQRAPRKQRHTAHRIYSRIRAEMPGCAIAESTVRHHVRERKTALGLARRETFVPQSYGWGSEAQVDWYEADAEVDGTRETLQVFTMRAMASGAAFHRAYRRATQQAFLEAHELGFAYFGGVFARLRYDNLGAAVKRILRGSRREETARFMAFRSHWRFDSEFCTPEEGHEKGGVENEVGRFRRNHWVPVPQARDLADLNQQLLAACREDEERVVDGRTETVGAALATERAHLMALADEPFDLVELSFPTVNTLGCVKVKTNAYSVPLTAGTAVQARLSADAIAVWHGGRCVARHERCHGRQQEVLDLEHYLDVLAHKPGALAGSTPLAQARAAGRWPASYDRFWAGLVDRHGRADGTKEMIGLLQMGRRHGQGKLRAAVEEALALGCHDGAAVRYLVTADQLARPCPAPLDVGRLVRFERPPPTVADYDQLLAATR
jgi:transposase